MDAAFQEDPREIRDESESYGCDRFHRTIKIGEVPQRRKLSGTESLLRSFFCGHPRWN